MRMQMGEQILWGSIYLGICLLSQILVLAVCGGASERFLERYHDRKRWLQLCGLMSIALVFILFAHTLQVWLWAGVWVHNGALPDWNTSVYFSLVTYSTLGYGDITLGPEFRIMAAFSSINGVLGIGISTAFLVALLSHLGVAEIDGRGR